MREPVVIVHTLTEKIRSWDAQLKTLDSLCRACNVAFDSCRNLSCPRLYIRTEAKHEADQIQMSYKILSEIEVNDGPLAIHDKEDSLNMSEEFEPTPPT